MNLSKSDYLKSLLIGRRANAHVVSAALVFWHSEIDIEDAKSYMDNFERKANIARDNYASCVPFQWKGGKYAES